MENSFALKISDKKGGQHNYVHLYKANYMTIFTVWFYIGYTEGLFLGLLNGGGRRGYSIQNVQKKLMFRRMICILSHPFSTVRKTIILTIENTLISWV